jgi:mRNA-degrading endonuclease RelE of RelBE toxin-antitoxin system
MPRFERAVKHLKKRYRNVTTDFETALEAIEVNPAIGLVIPDDYMVRKLRVASRDMRRGKSGGFRLIYLLRAEEPENPVVYLLFVYAKTDRADVTLAELKSLVSDLPLDEDDDEDG